MRFTRILRLLAVLIALTTPTLAQQPRSGFRLEDLAWMSGRWSMSGEASTEEIWGGVDGTSMLGMSKTTAGGKTVFFEYLRIESRGDDLYYVAHPNGKSPGTDFRLVRLKSGEAVFENPTHDFPKRISYRRNADGSLTARVEGDGTEKEKPQEFRYLKK